MWAAATGAQFACWLSLISPRANLYEIHVPSFSVPYAWNSRRDGHRHARWGRKLKMNTASKVSKDMGMQFVSLRETMVGMDLAFQKHRIILLLARCYDWELGMRSL